MRESNRPPSEGDTPYLSANEAANYLRVSRRVLQSYRISGDGPAYRKHGARVVYHREDLDGWSGKRRFRGPALREDE